jgi:choline dehydrogenase-like flavoprotein
MVALQLAKAGLKVMMLERGRWIDRDDSARNPHAILIERKCRSGKATYKGKALMEVRSPQR